MKIISMNSGKTSLAYGKVKNDKYCFISNMGINYKHTFTVDRNDIDYLSIGYIIKEAKLYRNKYIVVHFNESFDTKIKQDVFQLVGYKDLENWLNNKYNDELEIVLCCKIYESSKLINCVLNNEDVECFLNSLKESE